MIKSQYSNRVINVLLFMLTIAILFVFILYFMADNSGSSHTVFKTHYGFVGGVTLGVVLFIFSFSLTMTMVKDVSISDKEIVVRNLIGTKKTFYKPNTVCALGYTKRAFFGATQYIVIQEDNNTTKIFEFTYKNFEELREHLIIDVEGNKRA